MQGDFISTSIFFPSSAFLSCLLLSWFFLSSARANWSIWCVAHWLNDRAFVLVSTKLDGSGSVAFCPRDVSDLLRQVIVDAAPVGDRFLSAGCDKARSMPWPLESFAIAAKSLLFLSTGPGSRGESVEASFHEVLLVHQPPHCSSFLISSPLFSPSYLSSSSSFRTRSGLRAKVLPEGPEDDTGGVKSP